MIDLQGTLLDALAEYNEAGSDEGSPQALMRRYLDRKAWLNGVPISGSFELTPLCNLDCKMCYVHLKRSDLEGKKLLSGEQWKSLIKQAVDMGLMYARVTGGECLTYPDFDEIYLYLLSFGVQVVVLTNGLLLTEERVEFFKRYQPSGIQITIYGSDDDAYEAVTGKRVFSQVMDAVQRVKKANLPLSIAITPSKYMISDAEKLIRMVASLGVSYNINPGLFEPFQNTGRSEDDIDIGFDEYVRLFRLKAELAGRVIKSIKDISLPEPKREIDSLAVTRGLKCSAGRRAFALTWDGRMKGCTMLQSIEEQPLKIGFAEAWKHINEQAKEYLIPQECEQCSYSSFCPVCVVRHEKGAQRGHANSQICGETKRLIQEGLIKMPDN